MGRHAEKQPAYKVATEVKKGKAVRARYPTIKLLRKASFWLATRRGGPHGYCGFFELRAFTGIDTLTGIVVLEAVSDWLRQWQAIDFAESGYGRANDIDK